MDPSKNYQQFQAISLRFVIIGLAAFSLAACEGASMQSGHDFVVEVGGTAVSVHVAGAEIGASPAELDTMIKNGVTCGLQRGAPVSTVLPSGQSLKMTWSANGQLRPEMSSVNLHLTGDNLPTETAMERISLQQSTRPMFVQAVCDLTADSLATLRRDASARTASGVAIPPR